MKITIYRTAAVDPAILAEIPSAVITHGARSDNRWSWECCGGILQVTCGLGGDDSRPDSVLTYGYPLVAIDRFEVENR